MSQSKQKRVFQVKWATNAWEIEQASRIRREVFCEEQGLFDEHDRDEIDLIAQPLIVTSSILGMPEEVVGTVRIHQPEPGLWLGSRLAVKKVFRSQIVLGASLIRLAVSSANTLGCHTFLATVQERNEVLFKRLHWATTGYQDIHGMKHANMQADLEHYPPLSQPSLGFWVSGRPVKDAPISPYLLGLEPKLIKSDLASDIVETSYASATH
jgi:putative N-acetyltransferase (TIGR04045 family)